MSRVSTADRITHGNPANHLAVFLIVVLKGSKSWAELVAQALVRRMNVDIGDVAGAVGVRTDRKHERGGAEGACNDTASGMAYPHSRCASGAPSAAADRAVTDGTPGGTCPQFFPPSESELA